MKKRPISIGIIAISQGVIASVLTLYNLIFWGFNSSIFLLNIAWLVFILFSSFGLWKAKEWGWWLTNIFYIQILIGMVISSIYLLYFVPIEIGVSNMVSSEGLLAIISGLLIPFYLFRKIALNYFNISNHRLKLIIILIIALIWSVVKWFLI